MFLIVLEVFNEMPRLRVMSSFIVNVRKISKINIILSWKATKI